MPDHQHFIVTLARFVELLRERPDARDDLRTSFRLLAALCQQGAVTVVFDDNTLAVAGEPVAVDHASVVTLLGQLRSHGIGTVRLDPNASDENLFRFLRTLAGPPSPDGPLQVAGITVARTAARAAQHPAKNRLGTGEFFAVLSGEGENDSGTSLDSGFDTLHADPYGEDVLHHLSALVTEIDTALHRGSVGPAVAAIDEIVRLEEAAPDDAKRAYGIALRRLLSRKNLEAATPALLDEQHAHAAVRVFIRGEDDAVRVLLPLIEDAADAKECNAYYSVFHTTTPNAGMVTPLLSSERWYVAMGAANVLGECGHAEAVRELADAATHDDPRVRSAVLRALTKIGTGPAVEHVRDALSSNDPERQSAVAAAVEGRASRGLAMPLAMAAEAEGVNPGARGDLYLALGRIGTPDALQALLKAAAPGGRILGRKPTKQRVSAIDGMRQFGPGAEEHLSKLTADRDKAVARAAEVALADVRSGRK